MKKDQRMEFRLPQETKDALLNLKHTEDIAPSEYVRKAISEKLVRDSHESQTESLILINKIHNLMNAFPKLDPKFKNIITKELNEYEN